MMRLNKCGDFQLDIHTLAQKLHDFEGVSRKAPIADIARMFDDVRESYGGAVVDMGDDAAIIDIDGDDVILFAADGIWGRITEASPWWTGYTSVVVNINDISAMGARPLAMVNVMSSSDKDVCDGMLQGMKDGVKKFGVPMVGGHLHPDTPYNSLAVSIIGIAKKDCVIRSDTACVGDTVIVGYDMDGRVGKNSPYSWDTTSFKDPETVRSRFMIMQKIGERHLVTAGKDISNPGTIGTLGMLCETSMVGAEVDLRQIPKPADVALNQWLMIYPATGYIVTAKPENVDECLDAFEEVDITAAAIGKIDDSCCVKVTDGKDLAEVFDFSKDLITGIQE